MTSPGEDVVRARLTSHALTEMARRGITPEVVRAVLRAPGQRIAVRPARVVCQSVIDEGGRRYLVRVFVDIDREPPEVVTAYRTSKIEKYWRER